MLNHHELTQLLKLTTQGNRAAFTRLYDMVAPVLLGLILQVVSQRKLAEELLQASFVQMWNQARELNFELIHASGWLVFFTRQVTVSAIVQQAGIVGLVDGVKDDISVVLKTISDKKERESAVLQILMQKYSRSWDGVSVIQPNVWVWAQISRILKFEVEEVGWIRRCGLLWKNTPKWLPAFFICSFILLLGLSFVALTPSEKPQAPLTQVYSRVQGDKIALNIRIRETTLIYSGGLVAKPGPDEVLQLWVVRREKKKPHSLGILNVEGGLVFRNQDLIDVLHEGGVLAVSVEPMGGSSFDVPTGPVTVLEKS